MQQLLNLAGKTALITGASSQIGGAIAKKLNHAGAKTILHCAKDPSRLEELASELNALQTVACDLSSDSNIEAMISSLASTNSLPDLLINNAGVQSLGSIRQATKELWRSIDEVNLEGVYSLTKHLSNALIAQKRGGVIINIASIEGLDPAVDHSHYAASKAGLIMYTRASALELGEHGIRVNAVAPGLISRPNIQTDWPEGVARWQTRAPLSRLGTGDDIANGVLYLASPAAAWVTGTTLVIDGGMSAQNRW